MAGTRKLTAIALGISALSISFLTVVFPGVAAAGWTQDEHSPTTVHISTDSWPWDQPSPAPADTDSDSWPWDKRSGA